MVQTKTRITSVLIVSCRDLLNGRSARSSICFIKIMRKIFVIRRGDALYVYVLLPKKGMTAEVMFSCRNEHLWRS
jgi:hypothetical protein